MTPTILVRCAWCQSEWRKLWDCEDDGVTTGMCDDCAEEREEEDSKCDL